MLLNEIKPAASLAEFVRLYRIIDFRFPSNVTIPAKRYSPRPEQCLQFYPKDTETVSYCNSNTVASGKKAVITGQHTLLSSRQVGATFLSLQVVFLPGGLYRLTGVPMHELVNLYLDAEDILGNVVRTINEQLFHASSYAKMISIVEKFLSSWLQRLSKTSHVTDVAGKQMLQEEEKFNVDWFAKESCLCHRQFDRKFKERVGIAPKQFLQLVRFDRAYRMKNRYPELDWLSIALRCGYHDYQHLVKDYKEFTGYTPTQFFALDNQAPERAFGDAEI